MKNYWWTGTSGGYPTLYSVDSNGNPPPTYTNYWKPGRLHAANPGALGVWSGKQFDWPCPASALADDEMISGTVTFRINSLTNTSVGDRMRLFALIAPWKNGLNGILHIMASSCSRPPEVGRPAKRRAAPLVGAAFACNAAPNTSGRPR